MFKISKGAKTNKDKRSGKERRQFFYVRLISLIQRSKEMEFKYQSVGLFIIVIFSLLIPQTLHAETLFRGSLWSNTRSADIQTARRAAAPFGIAPGAVPDVLVDMELRRMGSPHRVLPINQAQANRAMGIGVRPSIGTGGVGASFKEELERCNIPVESLREINE
jgi:hypothetical protein